MGATESTRDDDIFTGDDGPRLSKALQKSRAKVAGEDPDASDELSESASVVSFGAPSSDMSSIVSEEETDVEGMAEEVPSVR